jgi:hypothetical protein
MGGRNRVGIGFSYRPAGLHRLAEFIPWNRFLGSINVRKFGLSIHSLSEQSIHFQGSPFTFRVIHSFSGQSIHFQGNPFTFRSPALRGVIHVYNHPPFVCSNTFPILPASHRAFQTLTAMDCIPAFLGIMQAFSQPYTFPDHLLYIIK